MNDKIMAGVALNLLVLEDSVRDFEIIREQLIDAGYNLNISRVDKEKEFESSIRGNQYDIILADFKLPGFDAFGALRLCNAICPEVPFICVSGSIGEETAIELIKQGAVDYILKDRLARLPSAIKRALDEAKEKEAKLMAEEVLQKTEQQTRTFLDATSDMAFLKDESFRHIIVNFTLCKFYGKTESEIIGKTDFDLMDEKAAAECRKTDEQTLCSNDIRISEEVVGGCYYETRKFPVDLVEGKKGVGAYIRDITESKRAEKKLKENANLLRIAGEKAKLGGWSVDLKNNLCTWSYETAAIHERPAGYAPLVEEGISYYAPEWREKITKVFTQCAQNGIPYDEEMEIITANDKRVWVRTIGESVNDEAGKIIKVQGAFQDITERKQAEEEIKKLNEDLEQRINERTAELTETIAQLEELNHVFVDRELKMVELKERIAELERK